ncbi:odorant receptor 49b-like [Coccinella septempunctata]|uniref:odorant receptor 49b-like n=1 Tax=Coccinella septempunctata TaxID=41139 RepID=UPI001D067BBD|nr:odorant receptor 49b-like [Coccinella septempunctata]
MHDVKDKQLRKILSSTTEPILRAFLIYMFAVIMTNVSFMGLCGYLRYKHTKQTKEAYHPFEMLLPFDRDEHYNLTLLVYMLTESVTAFMAYTMDMALLVFIIFHILRLKFLQHVLRNFKHYTGNADSIHDVDRKITYKETASFWRNCISEHQDIISDVEMLNKQMSKLFFIDFFLRTIQMAGFCLGGIKADQFMNQFFGFGCLMCSSSQLTILYWYGEVLTSESVAISDAIYESEWYDADMETRRTMLMMMRRSQRCLILTVGKFEKVALRTVLRILKSIYSCMSIIVQRQ